MSKTESELAAMPAALATAWRIAELIAAVNQAEQARSKDALRA